MNEIADLLRELIDEVSGLRSDLALIAVDIASISGDASMMSMHVDWIHEIIDKPIYNLDDIHSAISSVEDKIE
jgi:hypothetical protein